jgi:hypothetical protein
LPATTRRARWIPHFGSGGTVVVSAGFAEAVAIQDDGALPLAGNFGDGAFSGFGVMRLLPDGSPDSSIGTAGLRVTALADGHIAAAGGDWDPPARNGPWPPSASVLADASFSH